MIFLFIAVFSVAGIVIDSLIGHLIMFYQFRNKFFRLTFILLFVGAIIFFARNTLKYLAFADIVALLITLFYGIILLKNSNQPDDVYRLLVPKYSINIMLSRNLGAVVGPLLIISSMICISLFCMGYLTANNKRDFFILPDNKTVFLKKYGTTIIMGSLEGEKISSIFVRNEPVRIDTLKTIRLSESY